MKKGEIYPVQRTLTSGPITGSILLGLCILMVQGLVNSFGTVIMAAFAAAVKIDSFAYMPVQDFGNAFSTYVAQNYGAGQTDRIRKGILQGHVVLGYAIVRKAGLKARLDPERLERLVVGDGVEGDGIFARGCHIAYTSGRFATLVLRQRKTRTTALRTRLK